jgi:hypothetical protein
MNEKILTRKEFEKLIHENHESLTFVQKKKNLQNRAKDISLMFLSLTSLTIYVTCVVFHFFY